jgi:two-component system phosphate regulon sensor histidine kinase PhoR
MAPIAESRGVQLRIEPSAQAVVMRGDANWLERIILNLLDNAIKFTPAGGSVTVSTSSTAASVVLTVTDTGCGIPAESLPRIFERFYQVDPARSSSGPEGVGLGLSLVKWAVTQHGGTIEVRSETGRGTSFRIVLPQD